MPPHQTYPQVPSLAQTGTPNLTFFCEPLLLIVSRREMTIKHLLYTQLCAFMYTKGACVVFFWFWNSPMKIFYDIESVASISDQREYKINSLKSLFHETFLTSTFQDDDLLNEGTLRPDDLRS